MFSRCLLIALLMAGLSACASYGKTDLHSVDVGDGLTVKLVSIVDAKTNLDMKTAYRGGGDDTKDIYANRPLRAQLSCEQKTGGNKVELSSRVFLVTLAKRGRMSFAPVTQGAPGQIAGCDILINIQDAKGNYRVHEFDRVVIGTVEGREVYGYKLAAGVNN